MFARNKGYRSQPSPLTRTESRSVFHPPQEPTPESQDETTAILAKAYADSRAGMDVETIEEVPLEPEEASDAGSESLDLNEEIHTHVSSFLHSDVGASLFDQAVGKWFHDHPKFGEALLNQKIKDLQEEKKKRSSLSKTVGK